MGGFSPDRGVVKCCRWWAFSATQYSPGAKAFYLRRRATGDGHEAALRRLASKLGQLHHCPTHRVLYDEQAAWPDPPPQAIPAA